MLAIRRQKTEVVVIKALNLLLHDERFSGWTPSDKVHRKHFSIDYMSFYKKRHYDPVLYTFHERVKTLVTWKLDCGTVKTFPVKWRFPPFLRFGNDHSPRLVLKEMVADEPDIVHFHNYYLFSFPYIAPFVKRKLKKPLIAQLHSYDNRSFLKWPYLPCLLALKNADRILFSYEPERTVYRKLGIIEKAVKLPVPGVDPEAFKPRRSFGSNRLLYVGRIPGPEKAHGEKSPFRLIQILKRLLRRSRDVVLDVVGDGPGVTSACALARNLGIADHVVFHGYVPHDELPKYYQSSTLTFSPIEIYDVDGWFDGSIQESLACGTPVAAFKASRNTPLNGTYGFLLSNTTGKAAEELDFLLKAPEKMVDVARCGSRFVRENCSSLRVASQLGKTIESVV